MESINERMSVLIKELGLNKNSFSAKIGLSSNSVIQNIVSGRQSAPSFDVLSKTLSTFADVDANWLMTGHGTMFKAKSNNKDYKFEERSIDIVEEQGKKGKKNESDCPMCDVHLQTIELLKMQIESQKQTIESKNQVIELLEKRTARSNEGTQARSA